MHIVYCLLEVHLHLMFSALRLGMFVKDTSLLLTKEKYSHKEISKLNFLSYSIFILRGFFFFNELEFQTLSKISIEIICGCTIN